ncbi:Mobile element protein [Candidatus Enterovibrio escicola]|uniref:Mobile element protein n=1 Tax=Candidatus Enterovibrio escicola TaxID=1927127 RepID=A0A2A5T614_9GAMM|nr:Mobile element protein [Candidatus Enterovibrio escacola]
MGKDELLPTFLNPLRPKIQQVCADGVYDTSACHHVLKTKE